MTYNRQHIFSSMDGQALPGQFLDDDFNAVQAAMAELSATLSNAGATDPVMVDASDPCFAPSGTESDASRVAAAIQAALASGSRTRVVWVPNTMWGYAGDADFSADIFNPSVFLVREGAVTGWYDPVAYGADPLGVKDSWLPVKICHDYAAAYPGAWGGSVVAFTVAGSYHLSVAVAQQGVAMVRFPCVTFTGQPLDGHVAWTFDGVFDADVADEASRPAAGVRPGHSFLSSDSHKFDVWDGDVWVRINPDPGISMAGFTYNADATAGSRATAVAVAKWVSLKLTGTMNSSGRVTLFLDELGTGVYNVANLVGIVALVYNQQFETGTGHNPIFSVDAPTNSITFDSEGGSSAVTWGILLTFSS